MEYTILIIPAFWASFAACLVWFISSAKRNVPITINDAKTLWKIHKKSANCPGHKWQPITRKGDKISGFKCECGYKYTQKRPLVSTAPRRDNLKIGMQTTSRRGASF